MQGTRPAKPPLPRTRCNGTNFCCQSLCKSVAKDLSIGARAYKGSAPPPRNRDPMAAKCWFCLNSSDETTQRLHTFMLKNIASIDVESMTEMLHTHLQETVGNVEGTSREEIRQHIVGSHLLCPSLQLTHNMRSLLELRDVLRPMIITEDENGQKAVNSRNMSNYLKVLSEIGQMYRMGEVCRMLFFPEEKAVMARA